MEHRSRSEVIQEALRTHFGEAIYVPADDERRRLGEPAVDDLRRARDHYVAIDPALGDDLALAFDAGVERIRILPHGAPRWRGSPASVAPGCDGFPTVCSTGTRTTP